MQANQSFSADLLKNEERFTHEFFQRFKLKHRDTPLRLDEGVSKDYQFPTFYADTSCAIAIFHCNFKAAKALMPHATMEPVKMSKGRALIIFSCYEYRNVMNVAPYNEIAMSIPVVVDGGMNVPILTMLLGDKLQNFGYHVFHMPVTSLENRIRGRKIWGLPKELENIYIRNTGPTIEIEASIADETPYFELSVPTAGSQQKFDVTSSLYSTLYGSRLQSDTSFRGQFKVNKNMSALLRKGEINLGSDESATLKLGKGPIADTLRKLKIEKDAFQFRYTNSMNACFDLPKKTK